MYVCLYASVRACVCVSVSQLVHTAAVLCGLYNRRELLAYLLSTYDIAVDDVGPCSICLLCSSVSGEGHDDSNHTSALTTSVLHGVAASGHIDHLLSIIGPVSVNVRDEVRRGGACENVQE